MAQWRKVLVSGSAAVLTSVTSDAAITAGTSFVIGSADINETDFETTDLVAFPNLEASSLAFSKVIGFASCRAFSSICVYDIWISSYIIIEHKIRFNETLPTFCDCSQILFVVGLSF